MPGISMVLPVAEEVGGVGCPQPPQDHGTVVLADGVLDRHGHVRHAGPEAKKRAPHGVEAGYGLGARRMDHDDVRGDDLGAKVPVALSDHRFHELPAQLLALC